MKIRRATLADAPACAEIYAHYVRTSNATFETEPPTVDEYAERMRVRLDSHDWLVAVDDSGDEEVVVGFSYAGPFHQRVAYQWTIEPTIYLREGEGGRGVGTALYEELLNRMTARGFHSAISLVALPNPGSEALHTRFGFQKAGTMRRAGFKMGRWYDVAYYQKMLSPETDDAPSPLLPTSAE